MSNSKEKVIVTGGAGFIGSHLTDTLVAKGYRVTVIDNLSTGNKRNINPKTKFFKRDIRNLKSIKPLFKEVSFVFHLAAMAKVPLSVAHPDKTHQHNVLGTLNVLLSSRDSGVKKVIFSSSSSVYGNQKKFPLSETLTPDPVSPYGLQKLVGERYCKLFNELYGLETVSLRYFNVYGPRQAPTGAYVPVIVTFRKSKSLGKPLVIYGDGRQTRDLTYVTDVVSANIAAMKSFKVGNGEVINAGGGNRYKILSLARMMGGKVKFSPKRAGDLKHSFADTKKAKRLLGWAPKVKLEEGLKRLDA